MKKIICIVLHCIVSNLLDTMERTLVSIVVLHLDFVYFELLMPFYGTIQRSCATKLRQMFDGICADDEEEENEQNDKQVCITFQIHC